jgi:hypothetical protein
LQTADLTATASLFVALAALTVSVYAIYRGNRNTSAATLVTINEAFRGAWGRLLRAPHGIQHTIELAELMNLLETACAVYSEGSLAGVSQELMKDYLYMALGMIVKDEVLNGEIPPLLHEPHTFKYIKLFLKAKRTELSVTIPLSWYESYE